MTAQDNLEIRKGTIEDSEIILGFIKKLAEYADQQNYERLVTLSPLTPMATHFHISNGAKQLYINEETQNFEYKLPKLN